MEILATIAWLAMGLGIASRMLPKKRHVHEKWQLQDSAKGGNYCGACGEHVKEEE